MYKSFCSCTGNEQVSVFVVNEACNVAENLSCCGEPETSCCETEKANYCDLNTSACDCNTPDITYLKLIDKVVNEAVQFVKIEPVQLLVVYAVAQFNLWETKESLDLDSQYIDPPPIYNSTQEFLISIQQLKIPSIA